MGFFSTRSEAAKRKVSKSSLPVEYLQRLGLAGVKDLNPEAQHPNMQPTGSKRPILYVLGEAPGAEEDAEGVQFIGKSGKLLRAQIPDELMEHTAWDNCCRTRPPKNRTPVAQELECFRNEVVKSIEERKPWAILGVGLVPLAWALPKIGRIAISRGRRFPVRIGSHRCWFYPIHHPAYILRIENQHKVEDVPGSEWRKVFCEDIARVVRDIYSNPNLLPPQIESDREEDMLQGVTLVTEASEAAVKKIEAFLKLDAAAFAVDIETNCTRPYEADSRILSIALSTYGQTIAYPLEWSGWGRWQDRILQTIPKLIRHRARKIAHSLTFEMEWFLSCTSRQMIREAKWACTMIQAHVLDERPGGMSLDYRCRELLGLALKSRSKVNRRNLEAEPLGKLLKYNAWDAKYTFPVWIRQTELLQEQELEQVYRDKLERVPTSVFSQEEGIRVDFDETRALLKGFDKKLISLERKLQKLPEVAAYQEKFRQPFSPTSPQQLVQMLRDVMKRKEGEQRDGKYSTRKSVLKLINHPLTDLITKIRSAAKLRSTYVEKMLPETPESFIFADGRLHPQVKVVGTVAGRFSYEGPTIQNWPNRDKGQTRVRAQIIPPEGYVWIAVDYGQIEARVLGMASRDSFLCKALWEDYDIHRFWAERVAELWPPTFKKRGSDIDKLRKQIKTELVFAAFYGARWEHCAGMLELPSNIGRKLFAEFWDTFKGIKQWQNTQQEFYQKNRYIETLTGSRRRAPLSHNMILNSPIQGTAADMVIDAMNRLSRLSLTKDMPALQPVMNIHDDLTFAVPKKKLEDHLEIIIETMLEMPFEFVNVPIEVEASMGERWSDMEKIGKFSTKDAA